MNDSEVFVATGNVVHVGLSQKFISIPKSRSVAEMCRYREVRIVRNERDQLTF